MVVRYVKVCMKCGSKNIKRKESIRDGERRAGDPQSVYVCQKCGFEGIAAEVDKTKKTLFSELKE